MLDSRAAVGFSWAPNVTLPSKRDNGNIRVSHSISEISILNVENQLVDGLYVPPRNPRKLNKLLKKSLKETAGKSWFEMPAPVVTPEIKKDLEILKLRNVIDPKRHFKRGENSKVLPKYFQVGTVIEPASEFFSGRLTKKERKATLADEIISDKTLQEYRKRKVREVNEKREPGGQHKWKVKGRKNWRRVKDRPCYNS